MMPTSFFEALLKKRRFEETPSGDWPPEGSMFWGDASAYEARKVPKHFKRYEFGAHYDEQDKRVVPLAIDIMRQLCEGRYVLTDIDSMIKTPPKRSWHAPDFSYFAARCRRFLEKTQPSASVYSENERHLAILSTGFCMEPFAAYDELETQDRCDIRCYLFSAINAPSSAEQAWELVQNEQYEMQLWINDAPLFLEVCFDPAAADIDSLRAVVERVCERHGKLLF